MTDEDTPRHSKDVRTSAFNSTSLAAELPVSTFPSRLPADSDQASTSLVRSARSRSPLPLIPQFTSSTSGRPPHWRNFGRPLVSPTRSVNFGSFQHRRPLPCEIKQNGTVVKSSASTANTAPSSPTSSSRKPEDWMTPVFRSQPPPPKSLAKPTVNSTSALCTGNQNAGDQQPVEMLNLNVGGTPYRLRASTVRRSVPDSRLATFTAQTHENRIRLCDAYFTSTNEYFFERSAHLFDNVYKFFVTGQLHRPFDVCEQEFLAELQFWRIPDSLIATCCQPQYDPNDESDDLNAARKRRADENLRQRLYRFCEGDETLASTIFTFVSICFVLISVFGLVLGSIEEFQIPYERVGNSTIVVHNVSKARTPPGVTWEPHWAFAYLETICIAWFTLEYSLRLIVTPTRLVFMRGVLNVVDLIAIVPYYLELFLSICGFDVDSLSDIKGAFLVVRIMRVLRVVRILKLSRYSTGMRTFALTLRSSARQLGMMGMVLFTGVIFFSTLLYFVEKDEPESPFTSIPTAFWWAIVTMSTVGYGDQIPKTILGKMIASGAILSGVLVLALPITIIVDNFMRVSGSLQSRPTVKRVFHQSSLGTSAPSSPVNGGSPALQSENNEKTQLTR